MNTRDVNTSCLLNYTFVKKKGTLKSFELLQQEHGLQRQDFYRYLQVRHYFQENIARAIEGQKTGILEVFKGANN